MKTYIRIVVLALVLTSVAAFAAPHKLRVDDPALAKALVAQGAKVIGDYGAFTVLNADDALLTSGITNRVEVADDWNLIRLNARLLDTSTPEIRAMRKTRGTFAGKRLHLVQFAGPPRPNWLEELKQNGVQIVSYIPENSYLIYGDAAALARMQAWATNAAFMQWDGEYSSDLKVHPQARRTMVRKSDGTYEAGTYSIQLIADTNANPATLALINRLKTAPVRRDFRNGAYRNLVVSISSDQLDTIAAQPDVISIHAYEHPQKRDERQDQIVAGNLTGNVPSGAGYLNWLASKGFNQSQFDASGFVVDVADSGIDNGTTAPGHFGLYELGVPASSSRVAYVKLQGTLNPGGTLEGCDGHGNLNAHIIGNYDAYTGSQHQDSSGYSYGVGVCPFVKLGSSVIFDNSSANNDFTFPDYPTLSSDAYNSGARISSDSWGSDVGGDYDADAQTFDGLVRDADPNTPGNQEMTFVFAAGNAGPCTPSKTKGIDSPGSAKNVITVGASENVRSLATADNPSGSDACSESDASANSANDMSCSSSRGPCNDQRMKPDLVAPGIHITGGAPQNSPPPPPTGQGVALDCFNAIGVCALPGSGTPGNANNFFPLGQQFYTESSGTSHATPAVAGACALVRQSFINNGQNAPSPAMTKAFLMNSARYMTGSGANDNLWSPSQGMGEVNVGTAFDGVARYLRDEVTADKFTGTGQMRAYSGQVVDSTKPFRVTLAWTDAPGSTSSSAAYNNNLDLTVMIGGNIYHGNVFSGQYSVSGGKADTRNNVESVFLPAGVSGPFSILVTAANINSDGVPNEAPALDQDFALVVYNATAAVKPTVTTTAGNFYGLFYESSGVEIGRSGAINVKTTASGAYSGKLQIGTQNYSFSGTFDPFGMATNTIASKTGGSLGLSLNVSPTNSSLITGTVSDTVNWTANLRAEAAVTAAGAMAGNYTIIFPGTNSNAQLPAGDSYATLDVSTMGKIKLTGSLADGTKISQSATLLVNGDWALYDAVSGGQEQILGWLTFNPVAQESVGGTVNWAKAVPGAKFYPNGFSYDTHATGSIYRSSASPFGFNSGIVLLTGGNLAGPLDFGITVSGATVTSTNGLSLKFSAAKGTFKGSAPNPPNKTGIIFNGVFLQNQDFGSGYFLGTSQSGRVYFGPGS